MKTASKQPGDNKNFVYVLILLSAAFCIGAYLIITAVIIAKDGVTFIKYAQGLEKAPIETIRSQFQHPGYPVLIFAAHKISQIFSKGTSVWSWIYSAQCAALLFRLLALVVLYFIGKRLVGAKHCFLAILIFILLPKPAEFGSDALSDWPNLCFLASGFLVLLYAAEQKCWWLFGVAGLLGGLGYLVRPESGQLVLYGGAWSLAGLIYGGLFGNRGRAALALVLLAVGFLVVACPYMQLKGAVFPKKGLVQFTIDVEEKDLEIITSRVSAQPMLGSIVPADIVKAFGQLFKNIGEIVMWFFVPAWLIGVVWWFSKGRWLVPAKFLLTCFVVLNVCLMVWLYSKYGYMSRRHTLPLLSLTIFFVPLGLKLLAGWLAERFSQAGAGEIKVGKNKRTCFFVLVAIGVVICLPKLFRPIRSEKQGYKEAARWLKANTDAKDLIAVPDKRISFYAERKQLGYEGGNIPADAVYIVAILKDVGNIAVVKDGTEKIVYEYADERDEKAGVVIYKR